MFSKYAFMQGEFEMAAIVDMLEADDGPGLDVEVECVGIDTWETLSKISRTSAQFVLSELCRPGLEKAV